MNLFNGYKLNPEINVDETILVLDIPFFKEFLKILIETQSSATSKKY